MVAKPLSSVVFLMLFAVHFGLFNTAIVSQLSSAFSFIRLGSLLYLVPNLQYLEVELTTLWGIFDALLGTNDNSQAIPIIPKPETLIVHWDWFGPQNSYMLSMLAIL